MRIFPKEFEYRAYKIRRTSFNYRVVGEGIDEIVESVQDGKDLIDKYLNEEKHERSKKVNSLDADDLFNELIA